MKRTHVLTALVMAMLLCALMASCANQTKTGDLAAYEAENMAVVETDPVTKEVVATFTFEYGDGDTAILAKYEGKSLTGDVVTVPDTFEQRRVVGIGSNAFYHQASIKEVRLPDTLEYIDSFAFAECEELTRVTIPNGLTEIRSSAFVGCTKLETVSLSADAALETIGERAFWGCTSLKELTLPSTLKSIGDAAFWGCTSLESVELPDSVTSIGALAYYDCKGLETIKLTGNLTYIGDFAFVLDGSTLKNKIDLSGVTSEYVQNYVAGIAEPTEIGAETETDVETGVETEPSTEPSTEPQPADPITDPSAYLQELVESMAQTEGLAIHSAYKSERYVGDSDTPYTQDREAAWSHIGSDYQLSGQYVLLEDTAYLLASGVRVDELTAEQRSWIAENLLAESVLPFAPSTLSLKSEKTDDGVHMTISGLSATLQSTLTAQLESSQTVKSVESIVASGDMYLDADGRLVSVSYSVTISYTTSDGTAIRQVSSYTNSYSYDNIEAIVAPEGADTFVVLSFADAFGFGS